MIPDHDDSIGALPLGDPNEDEIRDYVARLRDEVDNELRSDRWVILSGSQSGMVRIYAGSLLWHSCELLKDVHDAIDGNREMAMRILHRAFHEAWLMGLYVQYGGIEATVALEADMKASFQAQANEAKQYDKVLKNESKAAAKQQRQNEGIRAWNTDHPDLPQRALIPETPVPQRIPINLSMPILDRYDTITAKRLNLPDVISRLNTLAKTMDDGGEHFGIVYTMGYRTLSSIGPHPNLEVIQSYFDATLPHNFVRLERTLRSPSAADLTRQVTLQCAAHLSERVLSPVEGCEISVTREILARYLAADAQHTIQGIEQPLRHVVP